MKISNHIFKSKIMKKSVRLFAAFIFAIITMNSYAQFTNISVDNKPSSMEIVQIDNRENSTLVFIKYTRENDAIAWMNINEKTIAKTKGSNREYHLINSINLPISSESEFKSMKFDRPNQEHAFVLEFEKLPDVCNFDIYEDINSSTAFNFIGVNADTVPKKEMMNIDDFISPYPVKELGQYAENGQVITYIKYKGIIISTVAQAIKQYGKYICINMNIKNLSGKSILFNPTTIQAKGYRRKTNEFFDMQVLSAREYDKTVARKQSWNNFWVALGQSMAASSAGYSSSNTTYSGASFTSGSAHASGYVGNTYGYANAYGTAYTTTYGRSHTTTYNGAAAYAAQQQAAANYSSYANGQYSIREQLNEGYVKMNTIRNEVEYCGYFNIKYKKLDNLVMTMFIDGEKFEFTY